MAKKSMIGPRRGQSATKRRVSLAALLTHKALKKLEEDLVDRFIAAERRLPPPDPQPRAGASDSLPPQRLSSEEEERKQLISDGVKAAGIAALFYVQRNHRSIFQQIVDSAWEFTEARMMKRRAIFKIRVLNKDERFLGRVRNLAFRAQYKELLSAIQADWKTLGIGRPRVFVRQGVGSLRYGDGQRLGTWRRQERIRLRANAVCKNADEAWTRIIESGGEQTDQPPAANPVTVALASKWVRNNHTPARISRQILGMWFGESPRRIKEMIDKVPRQDREGQKVRRNLDAREIM